MTTATSPPEIHETHEAAVPDCPFVGLVPFGEQHSPFFFGREREAEIIVANLAASRLTLLFAPSGVGKSSVLRAGVLPRLRGPAEDEDEDEVRSVTAVAYISDWGEAPLESAAAAIGQAVADATGTTPEATVPPARLDVDWVRHLLDTSGVAMLYLVLDQFEEYFFYHPADTESDRLTVVLGEILSARELTVHVLLSVREDTLASLDRFKGHIPHLFGNYLRLAHLTHDAARSAIEGPLCEYNRRVTPDLEMSVEPALVDDLLDQVHTGSVVVERDGPVSESRDADSRGGIETPYLQLVLTRLWEQERAAGSGTLRQHTLAELGGAQTVVQSHLDNVIAGLPPEQVPVAAEVFRHLVTASGAKIALNAGDLAEWSGQQVRDVEDLLERLSSGRQRILRPVPPAVGTSGPPRYEIFHDVMGIAVLDWRRRYTAERRELESTRHLVAEREQARAAARTARRRLRTTLLTVALVAALLVVGGVLVWSNYSEAQKQALLSDSAAAAGTNPEESLSRALDARWWSDDAESRSAVLQAASMPRGQVVAGSGAAGGDPPMWGMEVTPSADRVVTYSQDGRIVVVDPAGSRLADVQVDGLAGAVVGAVPAPDASRVAIATDRGEAAVVDITSGRRVELNTGMGVGAAVSWLGTGAAGTVLVVEPGGKAATFDAMSGKPVSTFPGPVLTAAGIDGGQRVVTSGTDSRLRVWDVATGAKLAESEPLLGDPYFLKQHDRAVVGVAGAQGTGELVAWSWEKGPKAVRKTFSYSNEILNLTIDKQANAAVVAFDKEAREYSLVDGSLLKLLPQQPDWVYGVAVSGDGQWLATAGGDGRTLVWAAGNSEPSRPTYELLGEGRRIVKAEFVGAGLVALEDNGNVRRWDLPRPSRFTGHLNWVLDVDLSRDGRWLATAGTEGDGYVLNPADLSPVAKFGDREVALQEVHLDPTDPSRVIGLGRYSSVPYLWQWTAGGPSTRSTSFTRPSVPSSVSLVSLDFSPDGTTIVAGDSSGGVHFWDSRSGELISDGEPPGDGWWAKVDYGPSGGLLATTVHGGIRLTDAGSTRFLPHQNATSVAFDGTGERLVSVADGAVRVWSRDGTQLHEFRTDESRLGRASFSGDGTLLAVGTAAGLVQVWDIESGVSVALARQHSDTVNDVVFAPGENSRLISASDDNSVAAWSCPACTDQQAVIQDAMNEAGG